MARELPGSARCVIVGGGVGGCSIAYHLARMGWGEVVLVDRNQLTSGSTFHSAGLVGQLRGSVSLTRMMMDSVELYRTLDCGWVECGGLRLASSPERWEETRRQAGWAKTFGLPLELLSADEALERFPLMTTDGVLGASWLPTDGYLDPSLLTYALAEGAREAGCDIHTNTRVTGDRRRARAGARRADRPRGDRGRGGGRTPAACSRPRSGGWRACASRSSRWPTSTSSRSPASRCALVTVRSGAETHLPTMRDPDLLIYFREDAGGLVMGGYERHLRAVGARRRRRRRDPGRLQRPPARGGLGALRGDHRQRPQARAGDGRGHDHAPHQRPRGVHARRRVLPRRVRGPRLLRRRRLLRPRARRRRAAWAS